MGICPYLLQRYFQSMEDYWQCQVWSQAQVTADSRYTTRRISDEYF